MVSNKFNLYYRFINYDYILYDYSKDTHNLVKNKCAQYIFGKKYEIIRDTSSIES